MPMKWIKYLSLILVGFATLLGLAVILTSAWFNAAMTPKSNFANYAEAKASGIMDRGWVPHWIPKSATDIHEQHDLDTNWVKMTFNYALDDVDNLRLACQSEVAIANGVEFKCGGHILIRLFDDGTAQLESPVK